MNRNHGTAIFNLALLRRVVQGHRFNDAAKPIVNHENPHPILTRRIEFETST
jgi:hypothetical protein